MHEGSHQASAASFVRRCSALARAARNAADAALSGEPPALLPAAKAGLGVGVSPASDWPVPHECLDALPLTLTAAMAAVSPPVFIATSTSENTGCAMARAGEPKSTPVHVPSAMEPMLKPPMTGFAVPRGRAGDSRGEPGRSAPAAPRCRLVGVTWPGAAAAAAAVGCTGPACTLALALDSVPAPAPTVAAGS